MNEDEKYEYENKLLLKDIEMVVTKLTARAKLSSLSDANARIYVNLKKQAEHTNKELEKEFTRKKLLYMKGFMEKQLALYEEKGKIETI